jgi:hypothetical protein
MILQKLLEIGEIMRDIIFGLGFLLILVAPVAAIGWIIYRFVKGSSGNDYTIK